uniref:Uncharacterized protein n=1 Tax=Timema douglasi TaxID=61478 RepID=A0A7R8W0U8_TIMDO|nr:unnamed protein product [Timema douglasi]
MVPSVTYQRRGSETARRGGLYLQDKGVGLANPHGGKEYVEKTSVRPLILVYFERLTFTVKHCADVAYLEILKADMQVRSNHRFGSEGNANKPLAEQEVLRFFSEITPPKKGKQSLLQLYL